MSGEVYDNVLYQVLNHCECSYETFLDLIFSFLYRRTYFFKRARNGCEKSGLLSEEMVKIACKKYLQLAAERQSDVIYEPVYPQECGEEVVKTTELKSACEISTATIKEALNLLDMPGHHEICKAEDMLLKENDTADLRICYDSSPECYNGASDVNYSWPLYIYDFDDEMKIWKKYIHIQAERQSDIISEPVYVQECIEEVVETTELDPAYEISTTSITELVNLNDKPLHCEICITEDKPVKESDSEKDIDEEEIVETTELVNLDDKPLHCEICITEDKPVKENDSEKDIDEEEIVETTELDPAYEIPTTSITESVNLDDKPLHCEICITEDNPVKENDSEKDIDDLGTYYDSNPECYNGASYDSYSWSQTICDLDVHIKVPNLITNGKQVKVHISHTHLKAEVLNSSEWEVVLHGQLSQKINTEGSVWTLDPGHHIYVHLEKAQEQFWEALLVGEPKINVQDIDCSKPYEDLPEEEQAKIQEVMYDHHQKSLGKPTVKESKVHEILKEAWNKDNSPFKGQKFDPSNFSVME